MAKAITPFLMFDGAAEEAMTLYLSLFDNAQILSLERWGAGEMGVEGAIKKASFTLCGRSFHCSDSAIKHGFTFTPSLSLFVDLESDMELERVFSELANNGHVLMPLNNYGFSRKFGWVSDRFGVSWQLNLPE
ncbi:VOC family protein [Dyella monticola]|uniref:VOC family protein n=1 Tax=Dyella monticola TaxID=1927958 RepID=A0A370X3V1_9GAMM|nr:VOC family protein [Dyella monticola]RDS83068.1 VOC family protein [Dyella monticola]